MTDIEKQKDSELELELQSIEEKINSLQAVKFQIKTKQAELRTEFRPGDMIEWGKYRGRILSIQPYFGDKVILTTQQIRRDGVEGRVAHVMDWQNPKKIS